ncbi:MAG: PstS family phosphate ABC transporter substrate-binding protein [Tannerella sp.]|jgi:phosphate transport system substrate-binding protein|nr:PstS family phosphate ABC transporter substrate-binding protein [Tannerella sp.]
MNRFYITGFTHHTTPADADPISHDFSPKRGVTYPTLDALQVSNHQIVKSEGIRFISWTRKHVCILLAGVMLCTSCAGRTKKDVDAAAGGGLSGNIQISGAFALYPMAVKWAEEFRKIHPAVKIDISGGGAGKGMTDVLAGVVDIGMVSREIYVQESEKGALPFAVVKDAVIPTIHADNPERAIINKTGLKREIAAKLWNRELKTWGEILGTSSVVPVHVYTRSDACGAGETFAAWFGKKQENLKATAVFGDPGVAAAVQKDRVAIGYNNIAYTYDQNTGKPYESMAVIPIDVNDNGTIEPDEDFYQTSGTLIKAINENRYPSPPARDLYLVTKGKPAKPEVIALLEYILSQGQQYAEESGYIGLSEDRLAKETAKLK